MNKCLTTLMIVILLTFTPAALASDSIKKGERAQVDGRLFDKEEVKQLMKDLAELDYLRERVVLLEAEIDKTENLVEKWKQQWENEKEKNLLLMEQYASLEREYDVFRKNSNRKWWYKLGIALVTGYLAGATD